MSITLVTIGVKNYELTKFALEKTLKSIPKVDNVKVFSDKPLGIGEHYQLPHDFSLHDYSVFAMKELNKYIDTDHVIMCHYDGMGVNKEFWDDKFLDYDYIGSATHYKYAPINRLINDCKLIDKIDQEWYSLGGGFNLRSKKLLNALADDRVKVTFYNYAVQSEWSCEDLSIGIVYKKFLEDEYDIKFGTFELSTKFCAEILNGYNYCLGFHGWHLSPFFFSEDETAKYIYEYIKGVGSNNVNQLTLKKFIGNCLVQNYDNVLANLRANYPHL